MPRRKVQRNPNEIDVACPNCGTGLLARTVQVVAGECWHCHRAMPIAFGCDGVTMMGPPEFSEVEIMAAKAAGANLQMQHSKTVDETYLVNTCVCGAFCGDFFLHDFWYAKDLVPPMKLVYACPKCGTAIAASPAADGSIWQGKVRVI